MKIRSDFVTNSSSSSFILARESKLNEKQKELIIQLIEEHFLGERILTPESTEEEIRKLFEEDWYFEEVSAHTKDMIRNELKAGKNIYKGCVVFEDGLAECNYVELHENIWKLLEQNGDGNFVTIDGNLYL